MTVDFITGSQPATAARRSWSSIARAMVMLLLFGCQKTPAPASAPKPTTKSVQTFLGFPVTTRPQSCEEEKVLVDDRPFNTTTCKLSDEADQAVYATYIEDNALPQYKGRLLKSYAILKPPLVGDEAKLAAFLEAFQEKYGIFVENEQVVDADRPIIKMCGPPSTCREVFASYNPNKQYTSKLFSGALVFLGQSSASVAEVSIWDKDLAQSLAKFVGEKSAAEGRALVR
jgi:hypothetical protein